LQFIDMLFSFDFELKYPFSMLIPLESNR